MIFSGAGQGAAFDKFISQDDYMREEEVSMQNVMVLYPWRGKWDMKFMQDYNFKVSGNKTNTIQFSIDVLNIGNLLILIGD
jgi:hypothetical protein